MAAAQRRGAARAAAKRRRQAIFLVVLVGVLAALLAWELPHVLNRSRTADSSNSSATPTVAATAHHTSTKVVHSGGKTDPFLRTPLPNQDAPAVIRGGNDPFKPGTSVAGHRGLVPGQFAPGKQFVIGRPGGHRVAHHGWIVILASIPTRNGHASAVHFARRARAVGALSILNSSNRRPLRGGYWVVYSGPDTTMSAVQRRASRIHGAGYGSAYIRELITYR